MNGSTEDPPPPPRHRGARLYHKKSRNGCMRCKARRVKCNEQKPVCGSCSRHEVSCVYNTPVTTSKQPRNRKNDEQVHSTKNSRSSLDPESSWSSQHGSSGSSTDSFPLELPGEEIVELPESEFRRLLELNLLQNYSASIAATTKSAWAYDRAPRIALQPGNQQKTLLYAIYAYSATELLTKDPQNLEVADARRLYLGLALREQRNAVSQLCNENAAAICFSSFILLTTSFADLRDRVLSPYAPPMEWLQLGSGLGKVVEFLIDASDKIDMVRIQEVIHTPDWSKDLCKLFSEENRKNFLHLLRPDPSDDKWSDELLDPEICLSYEQTLSFIGSVQNAINDGEAVEHVCRRLLGFPVLVPPRFMGLLVEQRPRALAMLAYFFALISKCGVYWFIGNIGQRELWAVYKVMPLRWQQEMRWPLMVAGLPGP